RQIGPTEAGSMASTVLALAAIGTLSGGAAVDRLGLREGRTARIRVFGGVAFLVAAASLGGSLRAGDPWLAAALASLSCLAAQATVPLWWSCAIGISGRHVGALFGLMNMVGVFGALGSQYLVGAIADWLGARGYTGRAQWDPIFQIDVVVLLAAGLAWS